MIAVRAGTLSIVYNIELYTFTCVIMDRWIWLEIYISFIYLFMKHLQKVATREKKLLQVKIVLKKVKYTIYMYCMLHSENNLYFVVRSSNFHFSSLSFAYLHYLVVLKGQ